MGAEVVAQDDESMSGERAAGSRGERCSEGIEGPATGGGVCLRGSLNQPAMNEYQRGHLDDPVGTHLDLGNYRHN